MTEEGYSEFKGDFSKDIQIKRKYGKHPAKFINIMEQVNVKTDLFALIPRKKVKL